MTRTVNDISLFSAVLLGLKAAFEIAPLASPPRVGICRSPHWPKAEASTAAVMDQAIAMLEGSGAVLEEVELSENFGAVLETQWTILLFESARVLSHERTRHRDLMSERLLELLDQGMAVPYDDYVGALDLARRCRAEIAPVMDRYDALLTPSAAGEAPVGIQTPSDLLFQRLWTILHLPCLTLPGFTGAAGLPVGIQLVGGHGDDAGLLRVARWLEALIPGG
jgi:Asp-tRNA(Asn)/Glu-tRNA(Gln) amidotransferase A subunit family amidase